MQTVEGYLPNRTLSAKEYCPAAKMVIFQIKEVNFCKPIRKITFWLLSLSHSPISNAKFLAGLHLLFRWSNAFWWAELVSAHQNKFALLGYRRRQISNGNHPLRNRISGLFFLASPSAKAASSNPFACWSNVRVASPKIYSCFWIVEFSVRDVGALDQKSAGTFTSDGNCDGVIH